MNIRKHHDQTNEKYPDSINRKFNSVKTRFSLLYTDVIYLILNKEKYYQSTIINDYTKKIFDVKWSKYNVNQLVMENLKDAINKIKLYKKDPNKIIIHSDHGYQYTSKTYNQIYTSDGIKISMGKNYHCTDNIIIECFHSLLKKDTIHNNKYETLKEYLHDVKKWNSWYQRQKIKDIMN